MSGHGINRYNNGCRCTTCVSTKADYMRDYRARALERGEHGYIAYTHGCRCDTCRTAKADYQRDLRNRRSHKRRFVEARPGAGRNYIDGIAHGLSGYQNHSCRCHVCRAEKSRVERRQRLARATAAT